MKPVKALNNQQDLEFIIKPPKTEDWHEISRLIAHSVPNALTSKLGIRFGAIYYNNISSHKSSCSYAAFAKDDRLAGIIIGTLDHDLVRSLNLSNKIKLLLACNFRILSPSVFRWLFHGWLTRHAIKDHQELFPRAELMILTIDEKYKGNQLANRLIESLESFFKEKEFTDSYLILTEESNRAANDLYEKIGAKYIKTYLYHGKKINAWEKTLM